MSERLESENKILDSHEELKKMEENKELKKVEENNELNKEEENKELNKVEENKELNKEDLKKEEPAGDSNENKKEKDDKEEFLSGTSPVTLDDKEPVKESGDENITFKSRCKLFKFNKEKQVIQQRGVGEIMIIFVTEKKRYKLTMVRDKICKLGCNHFIGEECVLEKHRVSENTWAWSTYTDKCDDGLDEPNQTYIVKFSTEELFNEFKAKFDEARAKNLEKE